VDDSREILILIQSDEEAAVEKNTALDAIVEAVYEEEGFVVLRGDRYRGAYTKEALLEILEVFWDLFEFALADNWMYHKCLEFYHALLFKCLQRSGDGILPSSFWVSCIC